MRILVIGGNRFFGKKLVANLLKADHAVTLLNRQSHDDGFGSQITRIKCDRYNTNELQMKAGHQSWDLIYDQVCYEASEARGACEIFTNRAERYIFTSSQSVYDNGANLKEADFDPKTYEFSTDVKSQSDYRTAKRQCESVFFHQKNLNRHRDSFSNRLRPG
jgi:nucleoside-diphosphate-sugar epimerase